MPLRLAMVAAQLTECSARIAGRSDKGVSTKLVAKYEYSRERLLLPVRYRYSKRNNEFLFLFDSYRRLDWGDAVGTASRGYNVVTWFFHREPFGHKIETRVWSGLALYSTGDENFDEVMRGAKRKTRYEKQKELKKALSVRQETQFLESFEVKRS